LSPVDLAAAVTTPPARPKLDPFTGIIDGILTQDEGRPRKQPEVVF
jgi:hypothetical protein